MPCSDPEQKRYLDQFNRGKLENKKFWQRFDGRPSLKGKSVLDLGCAHGSLSVEIALEGASKVLGVDSDKLWIEFAQTNLKRRFPQLVHKVEFRNVDLAQYDESKFDIIVSKDTFQHIIGLDLVLKECKRLLKPGGKLFASIGPLWNSPCGDVGSTRIPLPWAHLMISEAKYVERANRYRKSKENSIYALGYNKMSFANYRKVLNQSEMSINSLEINNSNKLVSKLFSVIRRIAILEEYFTHNIYCVLEKKKALSPKSIEA